jgi:thiamine kinase-like enzyme
VTTHDAPPVPPESGTGDTLDAILDEIEVFRNKPREIVQLSGGLTNRNYKVTTPEGCYVVRHSSDDTSALAINREHEYRNSVVAAESGAGAPVVDYRPDLHVLVVGYIDGVTFSDHSFRSEENVRRVASACRQLHSGGRFVNEFDMFDIQPRYLRIVREHGYRLPPRYTDYEPFVAQVKTALATRDEGTVPCNNDLLAANFVDDGQKIWLIDYEYSGNNDACFELGNIWSECHLEIDQLESLIGTYYGRPLRHKMARAQLQGLMSKYGWTLWASIQHATSSLDFDFWEWGMEKYDGAQSMFTGRDFGRLLEDAQRYD